MTQKVKPLIGNTLVKLKEVKKIGSIFLPDRTNMGGAREAEVIAVSEASNLKVGDVVVLPDYSARTTITVDGEDLLLCPEKDFLAVIQ